jgi:5-formyltetrahydrofolate cyclo-ligase
MSEKARLRSELIARRDAIPAAERARISQALTAALVALPEYAAARSVLATMSIGSEWSTREFLERAIADGKSAVLPRIAREKPRRLRLHRVGNLATDLVPGVWEIPEPDAARCPEVALAEVDFALVPALAVDRARYRLGYGAGYFDKLLAGRGPRPRCVTALPAEFVVESLPHESHDVPVDLVLQSP